MALITENYSFYVNRRGKSESEKKMIMAFFHFGRVKKKTCPITKICKNMFTSEISWGISLAVTFSLVQLQLSRSFTCKGEL